MENSYIHKINIGQDGWVFATVKITNYCGPKTQADNAILFNLRIYTEKYRV